MISGVTFERCPTRFLDADAEQVVLLTREGALHCDPLHGDAKLYEAMTFVRAVDDANERERDKQERENAEKRK